MGISGPVSRSTLADANEMMDWRIYAELAHRLIVQARKLYAGEPLAVDLDNTVYAMDSTTIDLCLSYPELLRRIRYKVPDTGKTLVFLSNHKTLPALTICALHKSRWEIEQFFRWIKQNLRIKSFYGTSENAVKTQIWIAVSVYVQIAIIKKRLNLEMPLYTFLRILSVTAFEKIPLQQAFAGTDCNMNVEIDCNQLDLFGY